MTIRQRLLKLVYPLLIGAGKNKKQQTLSNKGNRLPPVSFHSLSASLTGGKTLSFEQLRGKKVLLVNTASDCGYTPQFAELQKLYEQSKDDLEIIAFPANDFKEQEKGSDETIAAFCTKNYGVSFPLTKKSSVVKQTDQNTVFRWLTDRGYNGWNDKPPSWNFAKYLVNEEGVLTHYFEPSVSPLSAVVLDAVNA